MSDVDLLRRAAALMRERAEAATPGPWQHFPPPSVSAIFGMGDRANEVQVVRGGELGRADAEHIASWDPFVALAVADILDEAVIDAQRAYVPEDVPLIVSLELALARAYLREA